MISPTSHQAWQNEVAPTLTARQRQVLEAYKANPGQGLSDKEVTSYLGWTINRVCNRVGELVRAGVLVNVAPDGHRERVTALRDSRQTSPRPQFPAPPRYQYQSRTRAGKIYKVVWRNRKPFCTCWGFKSYGYCWHSRSAESKREEEVKQLQLV